MHRLDILQSEGVSHFRRNANLLARAVDESEMALGKQYGEWYPGETASRAEVENLRAWLESQCLADGKRVYNMMLLEIADVLARYDIYLRIPVFVQRLKHAELFFLRLRQQREIFFYFCH